MESRPLKVMGKPGPGKGAVLFRAMTACDCGCGRMARFEFCVGRDEISLYDLAMVKALIDEMQEGFERLWGKGTDV
jgi:hypothetical protein